MLPHHLQSSSCPILCPVESESAYSTTELAIFGFGHDSFMLTTYEPNSWLEYEGQIRHFRIRGTDCGTQKYRNRYTGLRDSFQSCLLASTVASSEWVRPLIYKAARSLSSMRTNTVIKQQ